MRIFWALVLFMLGGCATTDIISFTDPDFKDHKFSSFVVVTPNVNLQYSSLLQSEICASIKDDGAKCSRALDLFPPTRTYDGEQVKNTLQKYGVDAYLAVIYGGGGAQEQQVGALSYGTASILANTVTAYGVSIPVTSYSRADAYRVVLIDIATLNKAWVGGAKTYAQGATNISDKVFAWSLAHKIATQLKASRLL